MARRFGGVLVVFILTIGVSTSARASIVSATANVVEGSPPANLQEGSVDNDMIVHAYLERKNFVLAQDVPVNVTKAGTTPTAIEVGFTPGKVPAGTRINGHLIHIDSETGTSKAAVPYIGQITFSTPILGLILGLGALDASDATIGLPGVTYPTGNGRDLELVPGGVGQDANDEVTLSNDLRTLSFNIRNANAVDELRVITKVIPGDANGDGKVTGADYTIWAANFGKAGGYEQGDFTGDGKVTGADYTIWAANYQATAAAAAAVPEPSTGALLLTAGVVLLLCHRLRRV